MKSQRTQDSGKLFFFSLLSNATDFSECDQAFPIQVIYGFFSFLAAIFHAIRRALGFRIAQDDIDDFM